MVEQVSTCIQSAYATYMLTWQVLHISSHMDVDKKKCHVSTDVAFFLNPMIQNDLALSLSHVAFFLNPIIQKDLALPLSLSLKTQIQNDVASSLSLSSFDLSSLSLFVDLWTISLSLYLIDLSSLSLSLEHLDLSLELRYWKSLRYDFVIIWGCLFGFEFLF